MPCCSGWGSRRIHCHEPTVLQPGSRVVWEKPAAGRALMNISIFGLGYVGAVTAGCLARQGHSITGVDIHSQKVDALNQGVTPIVEPGLDDLLKAAKARGLLRATQSCEEAIAETDVSIVCVGTPSNESGALELKFVRGVTQQIAEVLRKRVKSHAFVLRSTLLPGSTAQLTQEFLSDLTAVRLLQVYYYPEFLRESTAVADFGNPALSIVGTGDGSRPAPDMLRGLFGEHAVIVDWATA